MNDLDETITEIVSQETAKGAKEIIIRTGDAPGIVVPRTVTLSGNIFAPGEFVIKRKQDIPVSKTNVVFDYDKLEIVLTIDEENHYAKRISGNLVMFSDLESFQINKPKRYSTTELFKLLRLKRAYFQNRDAHASILSQLQKLEVFTNTEFKSANDLRGSTAIQKITQAKSNLDLQFILTIPIFKGLPEKTFIVEIDVEPTDGTILCGLVSSDLAELEVQLRDEVMKCQLEIFKDYVIVER